MTSFMKIELVCPICDEHFSSEIVDLLETAGRKHTDFQFTGAGVNALAFDVHQCAHCGFAGPDSWFAEGGTVSTDVRRHVWDELTPKLSGSAIAASEKYEFAAKVATWDGGDPRVVGDIWMRAAWCAANEGDTEAERFYRRHAAWCFEEALGTYDGVDRRERAVLTYLVGELWRRIGHTARANEWFDAVAKEVVDPYPQAWIVRQARQQRDEPREWF